MAATAAQVAQLRRMIAEPTDATYTDATLEDYIEAYPLVDENGESPRIPSTTTPGVMMVNPDWTATYDLHCAAAVIWEEKAATASADFDFSADGGDYKRNQVFEAAMRQARWHQARRSMKAIELVPDIAREKTGEVV